jgi:hypothetical protein
MGDRLVRAALVALVLTTVLGWSAIVGTGLLQVVLLGCAFAVLLAWAVWFFMQKVGDIHAAARGRLADGTEGNHHAFAGVNLKVEDDGRHVWLDARSLQRVLGLKEANDITAARTPGNWRVDASGRTWLRVDAVIQYLNVMPGRNEPRVQKLRRYLERDVLFPARERHQRT